jgi:hypothetical protein
VNDEASYRDANILLARLFEHVAQISPHVLRRTRLGRDVQTPPKKDAGDL